MTTEHVIDELAARATALGARLDEDSAALAAYAAAGEALLADLPPRARRGEVEQALARRIFETLRRLRRGFMQRHAHEVHARLTDHGAAPRDLVDLVAAAADQFPGLVPDRDQLAAERRCIQADKEGREMDQAIFFAGLLRSPTAGAQLVASALLPSPRARALLAELRRADELDLGTVHLVRRGHVAHVTVNNQQALNAEDDQLIADLGVAIDLGLLDDRVRVGVLRGGVMTHPRYEGRRVFSAGINLRELYAGRISFVHFLLGRELGYISKLMRGLAVGPGEVAGQGTIHKPWIAKPWIAAVDGFAIGGGMQLLFAFDKVIAADDAYFVLPAAQEGIVPGAANLRLSRVVGPRIARQIILSGRTIRAGEPEARHFCDDIVPSAEIDAAIERATRELDSPAVVANRMMLNLAEEPPHVFREYMAEFCEVQAARLYSADVLGKVQRWAR